MKSLAALAIIVTATPSLGAADAWIYQGTIGDKQIVVEFSDEPVPGNTDLFGRYFYMDQGADIPLHATKGQRGRLGLAEEVACSEDKNNCPHAQDETPSDPPLGAKWDLKVFDDREYIEGDFAINGRKLPVELTIYGHRNFDASTGTVGLTDFASSLWYSGEELTVETSPYDYLKVTGIEYKASDIVDMTGGSFHYLTNPRTKFQFPRIVELDDGDDPAVANDYLAQRHWIMSLDALWCVSQQYQGFGWNGYNFSAGSLGAWDEENIEVHYLTPTIMTWTEGGSLMCGGAHPYNHYEYHNLDVKAGAALDLSRIFKGWVAKDYDDKLVDLETARANPGDYQWGPDEELLAFVNEHRATNEELGFTGGPDDCPIDELIPQYLAISFKGDDIVHFGMAGMPNVIVACASDLYDAPIAELRDLLTDEAADYFPVLKE